MKKILFIIILVLLIVLMVVGYFLLKDYYSIEKSADRIIEKLIDGDIGYFYDLYGNEDSDFVNFDKYTEMDYDNSELENIHYQLVYSDIDNDVAVLEYDFDDYDLIINLRVDGNAFLLFPKWVLDEEILNEKTEDYSIKVIKDAKVKIDDISLNKYLSKEKSNEYYDLYIIDELFTNAYYELEIVSPNGFEYEVEFIPLETEYIDEYNVRESFSKVLYAELLYDYIYSLSTGKSFEQYVSNYPYFNDFDYSIGTYSLYPDAFKIEENYNLIVSSGMFSSIDDNFSLSNFEEISGTVINSGVYCSTLSFQVNITENSYETYSAKLLIDYYSEPSIFIGLQILDY